MTDFPKLKSSYQLAAAMEANLGAGRIGYMTVVFLE
jgi:hypothetical protein